MRTARFEATLPDVYPWVSQAMQYPAKGDPGVGYFAGEVGGGKPPVDCILYRGDDGRLLGILNHYPVDYPPWEKAGNVNIWVHPQALRNGIATKMLDEAMSRWSIDLDQQRFTRAGADFATAYVNSKEINHV